MEQIWEQLAGSARAVIRGILVFYFNLMGWIIDIVVEIVDGILVFYFNLMGWIIDSVIEIVNEILVLYFSLMGWIIDSVIEIVTNKELIDGVCVAMVFLIIPLLLGTVVFGCLRSMRHRE